MSRPTFTDPRDQSFLRVAADEEALPFANASLDLVVSALALQFVNDLPGTLIQIRRALKPDGLLLAALVGGESLSELREAIATAEIEIEGGVSPHIAPFADVRELGALLQRAGFALPVIDSERLVVRYDSVSALVRDLRHMGATNILSERRRKPLNRATVQRMAEIYRERFADEDGRLRASFEIIWLSGWAPHEGQQKPLKPGSAARRLIRRPEHDRNIGGRKARAIALEQMPSGERSEARRPEAFRTRAICSVYPGESLPFGRNDGSFPSAANIQRHQKMKVGVAVARKGEGRETIVADGYSQFFP